MPLSRLLNDLFSTTPLSLLYHYTSLPSLQGIIDEGGLWATDIRYLNDSAELRELMGLLHAEISKRVAEGADDVAILNQFRDWLSDRIPYGNMVFVASFSERGNLLSQWRAYCQPQRGVSIGFEVPLVAACAQRQSYKLGQCIYDRTAQRKIAVEVLDAVLAHAKKLGPAPLGSKHPSQSFWDVFNSVENDLLTIASLLKHPSFAEEHEWRAVSPVLSNYKESPLRYRPGPSMLVPYILFSLTADGEPTVRIREAVVGPTPHPSLAAEAISRYLAKSQNKQRTIRSCGIPYRSW